VLVALLLAANSCAKCSSFRSLLLAAAAMAGAQTLKTVGSAFLPAAGMGVHASYVRWSLAWIPLPAGYGADKDRPASMLLLHILPWQFTVRCMAVARMVPPHSLLCQT
jgi:hypothetical protein